MNYSIEGVLLGLARCKLDVRREPCSAKVFRLDAFFLRTAFSNLAAQRYLRDISSIGLKRSSSKFLFSFSFINRTSSFHLKYLSICKFFSFQGKIKILKIPYFSSFSSKIRLCEIYEFDFIFPNGDGRVILNNFEIISRNTIRFLT